MKKIVYKDVTPGMVIQDGKRNPELIVYNKKEGIYDLVFEHKATIESFIVTDGYSGRGHYEYDPKKEVTILKGKKRSKALTAIISSLLNIKRETDKDLKLITILSYIK